jgi:flagellin
MPLVINSNISSLNSQRQLVKSGMEMDQAMERLSSGKRINTAADDAAGLAISNRQTSTILGLNRAVANANDGVSLVQTAEGALDETTNILQRMRELAIQSANGIYSDTDRATLNAETQQLKAEVDRIAETTSFNGRNVLDGSLGNVALQVGSQANQTIDFTVDGFNASSLGGSGGDVVGEASTGIVAALAAFTGLDAVASTLYVNDVAISTLAAGDLDTKIGVINADLEGKGAVASVLVSTEAADVGDGQLVGGTDELILTVTNGVADVTTYTISDTNSLDDLVDKINNTTGISASLNDQGKLTLAQEGVANITVTGGGGGLAASGFGVQTDDEARLVFTDTSGGSGVKIEASDGSAASTAQALFAAVGIDFGDNEGNAQGVAITTNTTFNAGDIIINGVEVGAITGDADATLQRDAVINAINAVSSQSGVVASVATTNTTAAPSELDAIKLVSVSGDAVSVEYGANATAATALTGTGLQERNAASGAGSVAGISIATQGGAQAAIDVIDVALEQINTQRSDLGAISNRLDFTMSNLMNVSENTASARSRIVDADFAAETANLSRAQVLQQAATAMLAQANAAPQQVLSLLR